MAFRLVRLGLLAIGAYALFDDPESWRQYVDGSDLHQFVTRPDIAAPRYSVIKHRPDAISPGYYFVTPHGALSKAAPYAGEPHFVPCTNGPHIYDGDGELVWSGGPTYKNRNAYNFRPLRVNDSDVLTFYVPALHAPSGPGNVIERTGFVLNNRYEELSLTTVDPKYILDAHEFYLQPDGKSTLLTTRKIANAEGSGINQTLRQVLYAGFQEIDTASNKVLFEWNPNPSTGIRVNESCDVTNKFSTEEKLWDFFHINSVDKFANGDYLISSRHMSAVYRISGRDGKVVWTLGGCFNQSDFRMADDVPFFWQHDARILVEDGDQIILSVFDNASDINDLGEPTGHNPPIGKILALDMASHPMSAKLIRRFDRPDKGQTPAEGGMRLLGPITSVEDVMSAHVLVNWAFEGYMSEYDANDNLLLEARFLSDRKRTYRAYKAPFKAYPTEPPILKVLPIPSASSPSQLASAFYVSWNGATEVTHWRFHGSANNVPTSFTPLANTSRRGFETSLLIPQSIPFAYAEALDVHGQVIGTSDVVSIASTPGGGEHPGFSVAATAGEEGFHSAPAGGILRLGRPEGPLQGVALLIVLAFAVYGFGVAGLRVRSAVRSARRSKGGRAAQEYMDVPLEDVSERT